MEGEEWLSMYVIVCSYWWKDIEEVDKLYDGI